MHTRDFLPFLYMHRLLAICEAHGECNPPHHYHQTLHGIEFESSPRPPLPEWSQLPL